MKKESKIKFILFVLMAFVMVFGVACSPDADAAVDFADGDVGDMLDDIDEIDDDFLPEDGLILLKSWMM